MNKKQETNLFVKECITLSLLNLMKKEDFNKISITEITKKAGVGRVTFYRNFDSKEDVIAKHIKDLLNGWWKEHSHLNNERLVEAIFNYYYKNRNLYILLYKQGLAHISLQSVKDACGPKPEQENVFAYASAFLSYGLYGWISEWFMRGMKESPTEMAELWKRAQKAPENIV